MRAACGVAADQRAAGLGAAVGDAAHDRRGGVDVQLAGGEIVQEEQRLGALHQHVVHAHGDQVDADRIVAVQLVGQHQLGAHAVGTRHQHRLAVLVGQLRLPRGLLRSPSTVPAAMSTPASR
ncbi:hypothetical protein G6F32_016459 [Rhizopus arrhizus]|nr:hypothetical protein G6F32_016459 [Rhizopus arrhizus]